MSLLVLFNPAPTGSSVRTATQAGTARITQSLTPGVIFHDACNTSANYTTIGANTTFGGNNGMFGTLGNSGSMHIAFSGGAYVFEGAQKNLGSQATIFQFYYKPASTATIGSGNTIFTAFTDGTYTTGTAPARIDVTFVSATTYKLTFIDPSSGYASVAGTTVFTLGTPIRIVLNQTTAGWNLYVNNGTTPEITYTKAQATGIQYVAWGTVYENAAGSFTGAVDIDEIWCGNLNTAPSTAAGKALDAYQGYLQNHLSADGQPYRNPVEGTNLSSASTIDTVSETVGYLLKLAVQNNDQASFKLADNWTLQNMLRSVSTTGNTQNNAAPTTALNLMAFHYNSANTDGKGIGTIYDANFATDADVDRAQALLWAHARWGSSASAVGSDLSAPNYLQRALNVIGDLRSYGLRLSSSTGYYYLVNDGLQTSDPVQIAPDYNAPAAYKLFAQYDTSNASTWAGAVNGANDILQKAATTIFSGQSTQVGLNPDWVSFTLSTGTVSTTASTYGDSNYGYNAFRSAYRLYDAWVWYGHTSSLTSLQEPKSFFTSQWTTNSKIFATFNHDGTNAATYESTMFTYPAYWSIYANDTGNTTASAINTNKLSNLYYQEPYGSVISESPTSVNYGYFGQSWTLVGYMQQNSLWTNYGQASSSVRTATQPGKARIATVPTKPQSAIARVATNPTKTQPATAKISTSGTITKTQPGTARIATNRTFTQGAVGRIQNSRSLTQPGKSRIVNNISVTQPAIARVQRNLTKTQPGVARIQNSGTVKTQPGISRIANNRAFTQGAVGRVAKNLTLTQAATARIQRNLTTTQPGKARIQTNLSVLQIGKSRISASRTLTQPAISRIQKNLTATQTGRARIINTGMAVTQGAISRIQINRASTQGAVSRISNNRTRTQPGISRIQKIPTSTLPGISRIQKNPTATQSATAKITLNNIVTKTQLGLARIQINRAFTQSATARIGRTATKTQTGTARISAPLSRTQSGTSRLSLTGIVTQRGTARIFQTQHFTLFLPNIVIPVPILLTISKQTTNIVITKPAPISASIRVSSSTQAGLTTMKPLAMTLTIPAVIPITIQKQSTTLFVNIPPYKQSP